MSDDESIEREVEEKAKVMHLDAHNKSVLRQMIRRENAFWDAEPFREDNHNTPVEGI